MLANPIRALTDQRRKLFRRLRLVGDSMIDRGDGSVQGRPWEKVKRSARHFAAFDACPQ
jgi:hypothetical protein